MKKLIPFLFLTVLLQDCNNTVKISDRKRPLTDNIYELEKDTFEIYKYVLIELEFPSKIDFIDTKTIIWIDGDCVYNDVQKNLSTQKIGIPKPKNGKYLIAINLVDFKNKIIYSWSSDELIRLYSNKRNVITLLYTGCKENPITLQLKK
jgi:hypothetical protein